MGRFGALFRHRRVLAVALIAITMVVPVASMTGFVGHSEAQPPETVLRIGFMQNVDVLNPFLGLNDASYLFYSLVYDSLQAVGNDLETVPNLALDSRVVDVVGYPYGSVWEYDITPNAQWHDGTPFTAEDVAWNINLNCLGANYTSMWAYQPYMFFAKEAVVVDEDTVRVTFYNRETGEFIPCAYADMLGVPMVPRHLLESYSAPYISFVWSGYFDSVVPKVVGTGPFMVTPDIVDEYAAGDQITLVRNPYYHGLADWGGLIHFDKLVMYFFEDQTWMKIALETGMLDVAQFAPVVFRSIQNEIEAGTLHNVTTSTGLKPTQYWTYVGFNMNEAGPNMWRLDTEARRALAQAVNKTYIVNNYYNGLAQEGSSLMSPVTPYWHWEPDDYEKFQYDLGVAASALQDAGYIDVDADGVRECTITSAAVQNGWSLEGDELDLEMLVRAEYPEEKEIARYLEEQWALIGVDLTFTVVSESLLSSIVYAYTYDTVIWYWSSEPDPNYMLFCQSKTSWNGWSDNKYYNPRYEENYTSSVMELDPAQRLAHVIGCQMVHYQDVGYIILAYVNSTYAWRTDTFINWGDWAAHPGRNLDAYWGAHPLLFDLIPTQGNVPPVILGLDAVSSVTQPGAWVDFNVSVADWDADSLTIMLEYGDGSFDIVTTSGTFEEQDALFSHAYSSPGHYDLTVWANDSYGPSYHNASAIYQERVIVNANGSLSAFIEPDPIVLPGGVWASLSAVLADPDDLDNTIAGTRYSWSVTPSALGTFPDPHAQSPFFVTSSSGGSGTVQCVIDFHEFSFLAEAAMTVEAVPLDRVEVNPSSVTLHYGEARSFRADALDAFGDPMEAVSFNWTVEGISLGNYSLNSTVGQFVSLTTYWDGIGWLNATATVGNVTRTGSSIITATTASGGGTVDYRWYDMFAVPNGEWWDIRWDSTAVNQPLTSSYPYLYRWYGAQEGNTQISASMRLNVTGQNLPQINMNSWPQFLPMLGTHRGGNATIDWYMQYMTLADSVRYPAFIGSQLDGWIAILNGTVTLDRDAAMTVLGIDGMSFDSDFAGWWAANDDSFRVEYANFLNNEGKVRVDIYNTYEYPFTLMYLEFGAQKIGASVVLSYDMVSWGMEVLMSAWLREAFMPGEWYMEDFVFQASIGPDSASIALDTACEYAIKATATVDDGLPCWRWEPILGDVLPSSPDHPISDYDPYKWPNDHIIYSPGSDLWGTWIPYDYTPSAFNLSEGQTLRLEWPAGDQLFLQHGGSDAWNTMHLYSQVEVRHSEPGVSDMPAGQFDLDSVNRTIEFVGPFDMWSWAKNQTSYGHLADEWDRVGAVPYGIPMIEFSMRSSEDYPASILISGLPGKVDAGTATMFTVSVYDQYGQLYPYYNGTVRFFSNDSLAVLPADYTFTSESQHDFYAVFNTPGYANLTVVDINNASLTRTVGPIKVGSMATSLDLEVSSTVTRGVPFSVRVTAYDQFGDVCSNYTGTVHFTTGDLGPGAVVPSAYTFVLGDGGTHYFADAYILVTPGWQDIAVEDAADPMMMSSATIMVVDANAPSRTYRVYDMFEEPFGWWWGPRWDFYGADIILENGPGMHTWYFLPGKTDLYQGMIYAPYRYSVEALNQSTLKIDSPVLMPIFGPVVDGASVDLDIYFQYLDPTWWESYWSPAWASLPGGIDPTWMYRSGADGYDLGTLYTVEMNREAAEQWLNLPQTEADVAAWWTANNASYTAAWQSWVEDQGNNVYDIYSGYDWYYDINGGTWAILEEDVATGNVTLTIAHIALGYEILMTRWLSDKATDISPLEPYYEDFQLYASYGKYVTNVSFNGVAQYSMHAVKANGTADAAAWAWEPTRVDFVKKLGHRSDYKPYVPYTYQSWNAGDTYLGQEVAYEQAPNWFNLSAGEELIFQLPNGIVPGYRGVALSESEFDSLILGDLSPAYAIMANGTMGLGYFVTGWPVETGLDLLSLYDGRNKTLRIEGPQAFNNLWHATGGVLYHGAPWIEFNVISTQPGLPPFAHAGPDQGVLPGTEVEFDGSWSYDDGPELNYTWTFVYGSVTRTLYGVSPSFTFVIPGVYEVTLTVRDSGGQTATDMVTITVDALIPEFDGAIVPAVLILICVAALASATRRRRRG